MKRYRLTVQKTFKDELDMKKNGNNYPNHYWSVVHRDIGWGAYRMPYGPFKTRKIARKFRKELDRVLCGVDYYRGE